MKEIQLKNRILFALVDDEDYERLSQFSWRLQIHGNHAVTGVTSIIMHNMILGVPFGKFIDHIDSNPLNNQKANLRVCTHKQNCANQKKQNETKSIYKGVDVRQKNYAAYLKTNGRKQHLGLFASEEAAAKAYDKKAKEIFGEFAKLNFPNGAYGTAWSMDETHKKGEIK